MMSRHRLSLRLSWTVIRGGQFVSFVMPDKIPHVMYIMFRILFVPLRKYASCTHKCNYRPIRKYSVICSIFYIHTYIHHSTLQSLTPYIYTYYCFTLNRIVIKRYNFKNSLIQQCCKFKCKCKCVFTFLQLPHCRQPDVWQKLFGVRYIMKLHHKSEGHLLAFNRFYRRYSSV